MILLLSGCQRDIPKPESKMMMAHKEVQEAGKELPAIASLPESSFLVHHQVNGKNLLVECRLTDISFRSDNKNKQSGKIVVYIDGKKTEVVHSPVFIIKGLPKGSHLITLEVVNKDNQPYPLKKELKVIIP